MLWFQVWDFDAWRRSFDRGADARQTYGCSEEYVYRGTEDANDVIVAMQFPDHASARAFFSDAKGRADLCGEGIQKEPTFSFSEPAFEPV